MAARLAAAACSDDAAENMDANTAAKQHLAYPGRGDSRVAVDSLVACCAVLSISLPEHDVHGVVN